MADELIKHLTRHMMTKVSGALRNAVNEIDGKKAWSGIRDDQENAEKAFLNHYGFTLPNGIIVPSRQYITNAVDDDGYHVKKINSKQMMKRAASYHIQDSLMGGFEAEEDWKETSSGYHRIIKRTSKTRAFGSHTTANGVMAALAKQMNINQKEAMVKTKENSPETLARKRKRSTQPLIDYGDMREATRYGVE